MVQITIDTKRDSPEEIRESIRYLQTLIGDEVLQEAVSESTAESAPGAFSMFGDTTPSKTSQTEDSGLSSDFSASDVFGSDEDAPSDVEESDDEAVIEIVEY